MTHRPDFRKPLFYSSLVLIGLLVGVLGSLWMVDTASLGRDHRPVEQISLGNAPAFPAVVLPETLATRGYVDALTLNQAFKTVSGFVRPSVVFIEVESGSSRGFFSRRSGGIRQSAGSGVIISSEGYVVTNHHVIEDASRIRVTLSDKREYRAEVVGDDPNTDLAVIRLRDAGPVPAIGIGDSESLEVGEWVLAVGNPFRLTSTVTAGIVSALGRQVNIIDDSFGIESFIQTDAAINPGNSGGALVNLRGELIGIATAIATESGSYEGYGFAVPVNLVERVIRDLIEFGEVQRAYLGVDIWPVDAERADALGLPEIRGVLLNNVFQGLAADQAGLKSGDVLLSLEGRSISEPNELQSAIALYRPGQELGVEVWRDGARRYFEVELFGSDNPTTQSWFAQLDRPQQPDASEQEGTPHGQVLEVPGWGLGLFDMTPRFQELFGLSTGAYVAFVENDSPAFEADLPRNVVILKVDGEPVVSAAEAAERFLGAEGEVLVEIGRRDGSRSFFEVGAPAR
jgi:Do/DeqQ family serine protease